MASWIFTPTNRTPEKLKSLSFDDWVFKRTGRTPEHLRHLNPLPTRFPKSLLGPGRTPYYKKFPEIIGKADNVIKTSGFAAAEEEKNGHQRVCQKQAWRNVSEGPITHGAPTFCLYANKPRKLWSLFLLLIRERNMEPHPLLPLFDSIQTNYSIWNQFLKRISKSFAYCHKFGSRIRTITIISIWEDNNAAFSIIIAQKH